MFLKINEARCPSVGLDVELSGFNVGLKLHSAPLPTVWAQPIFIQIFIKIGCGSGTHPLRMIRRHSITVLIHKEGDGSPTLVPPEVQSAAKLFEHLEWYLQFFSGLIANIYHLMLVINSINPKDHDLIITYFIKMH